MFLGNTLTVVMFCPYWNLVPKCAVICKQRSSSSQIKQGKFLEKGEFWSFAQGVGLWVIRHKGDYSPVVWMKCKQCGPKKPHK